MTSNSTIQITLGALKTYHFGVFKRVPVTELEPDGPIEVELWITIGDQLVPYLRDASLHSWLEALRTMIARLVESERASFQIYDYDGDGFTFDFEKEGEWVYFSLIHHYPFFTDEHWNYSYTEAMWELVPFRFTDLVTQYERLKGAVLEALAPVKPANKAAWLARLE